jgi:hypothetical protein
MRCAIQLFRCEGLQVQKVLAELCCGSCCLPTSGGGHVANQLEVSVTICWGESPVIHNIAERSLIFLIRFNGSHFIIIRCLYFIAAGSVCGYVPRENAVAAVVRRFAS